ncbi:hypothetical protein O7627_21115 [Solwaraspora sp. WMMD1047]|uniref:hypothetical protein n=1 Tax=Solwaraspora sp. WMMD1047 TaxID=3016102 RepID=UPI002415ED0A|nr:hypothetical protein [Solwaraspora sp. WMMD1047]MDG4831784.1 hypothetical protein [Solwaraspora sp. WMMD1047]
MSGPLVQVGDVIRVAEQDYCFGIGELRMRITVVPASAQIPGLEWVELVGTPLVSSRPAGPERAALIRVAALRVPGSVRRVTGA